jgi:hypothetical protein
MLDPKRLAKYKVRVFGASGTSVAKKPRSLEPDWPDRFGVALTDAALRDHCCSVRLSAMFCIATSRGDARRSMSAAATAIGGAVIATVIEAAR